LKDFRSNFNKTTCNVSICRNQRDNWP